MDAGWIAALSFCGYLKKVQEDFSIKGTAFSVVALQPVEAAKAHLLGQKEMKSGVGSSSAYDFFTKAFKRNPCQLWKGTLLNLAVKLPYNFSLYYTNVVMSDFGQKSVENYNGLSNFLREGSYGFMAGGISASLIHHFEFAAVLVEGGKGGNSNSGLKDIYLKILRKEGLRGAYRFGLVSVLHGSIYGGCFFSMYRSLDLLIFLDNANLRGVSKFLKEHHLLLDFLTAYPPALVATMAAHPFDVLRTRTFASAQFNNGKYNGSWDAAIKIYRSEGFSAFSYCWPLNFVQSISAAFLMVMVERFDKFVHVKY